MTDLKRIKYLIIGSGRMAQHLFHYLKLMKDEENTFKATNSDTHSYTFSYTLDTWDRNQDPHLLPRKLESCTHVLLAISDSSIENFYRKHLAILDKTVIHFSGALNIPGIIAAHPLMTFSHDLYDLAFYKKIHFALTGVDSFQDIFPQFENSFTLIAEKDKALYHAYCVMSGNLPVILWTQIHKELEKLNFPSHILDLYLSQVVKNFVEHKANALTGPIARKDTVTIQKNIEALPQPELQQIYKLFTEISL